MTETDRIECKRELSPDIDLEEEAVAFLNRREGGILYIGIDKLGNPVGVKDIDGDIQKIKAQKAGLSIKNNMLVYALSLFLYILYMIGYIGFIFYGVFLVVQEKNSEELNSYISKINSLTLKGFSGCEIDNKPKFITGCVADTEKGKIILNFASYPYWLYGLEWAEEYNVKIDGYLFYFTTARQAVMDGLEATRKQYFSECLNSPDAYNTAEEQMKLCQCSFDILKETTLQNLPKLAKLKEVGNYEENNWVKEMKEIYRQNQKEKCGHLIHYRKQE